MADNDSGAATFDDATEYSPAGFDAPDPELDDDLVVCAGCGEAAPASEMGAICDATVAREDGAVKHIERMYVHNDSECMGSIFGGRGLIHNG